MTNGINTGRMILQILLEIEEEENTAISQFGMLFPNISSFQDRRELFITRVCEGTLEYRILIDYIIDSYSKSIC